MGGGRRADLLALSALGASLLGFFLWPFLLHAEHFPLGPDGPVYLWWTRLAAHEGLGAVGERPGVPALALALGGTLRLSTVAVVSALEVALACAVGLAAAALAARATEEDEGPAAGAVTAGGAVTVGGAVTAGRVGRTAATGRAGPARGGRAAWLLAGLLSGTFAAHLAAGYLANLAFAAAFTAAAALLAGGGAVAAALAGAVLVGGGLAHPLFLLLGLAILGGAALLALRDGARREAGRLAAAGLGAGAGVLMGLYDDLDSFKVNVGVAYQSKVSYSFEVDRSILPAFDMPRQLNAGVTFYLLKDMPLRLTMDVQWIDWSDTAEDPAYGGFETLDDAVSFSMGAEYKVKVAARTSLYPRLGYRRFDAPWADKDRLPMTGRYRLVLHTKADAFSLFTFGIGIGWSSEGDKVRMLDLAGEFGGDSFNAAAGVTFEF